MKLYTYIVVLIYHCDRYCILFGTIICIDKRVYNIIVSLYQLLNIIHNNWFYLFMFTIIFVFIQHYPYWKCNIILYLQYNQSFVLLLLIHDFDLFLANSTRRLRRSNNNNDGLPYFHVFRSFRNVLVWRFSKTMTALRYNDRIDIISWTY